MGPIPKLHWSKTKGFNSTINKKQRYFGRDKKIAERDFQEALNQHYQGRLVHTTDTVASVVEQFLEYVEETKADSTCRWYKDPLERFIRYIGRKKKIADVGSSDLEKWLAADWAKKRNGKKIAPNTRRQGIRAVKRCFNWWEEKTNVPNPFKRFKVGNYSNAKTLPTDEQLAALLQHFQHDENLTDLLNFLVLSGCRVWEARFIRCEQVNLKKGKYGMIELDEDQTKNFQQMAEQETRTIRLTAQTKNIVERNLAKNKGGLLFQNPSSRSSNNIWLPSAIRKRFKRAEYHLGFYIPPKSFRHYWATAFLRAHGNLAAGSNLLGHTTTKMLLEVYNQIKKDEKFLDEQANVVKAIKVPRKTRLEDIDVDSL